MKTIILFLFLAASTASSQELTFEMLDAADKKPKGDFMTYVAKDGTRFTVGEKIEIGQPSNGNTFNYVEEGDGVMTPMVKSPVRAAGDRVEVKRIDIWGNNRVGWYAVLRTVGGFIGYSVKVEQALRSGELIR